MVSRRLSKSRPTLGLVTMRATVTNQRGETVAECTRQALMRKKPKA